jgi:pyruvate dehydrogenase E2 component (dihydrolipoamide acetyltransferase)
MTRLTPLAASAARQLRRDPQALDEGDARVPLSRLVQTRPAAATPTAPRFAADAGGAVLRSMARQTGTGIDALRGSGTPATTAAAAEPQDTAQELGEEQGFPPAQRLPLSGMRRVIAARLAASKRDAPHYYMSTDCHADPLLGMRRDLNALLPEGERLSVNDLVLSLVARCLVRHPALNAAWAGDAIARFDGVNLAVAVAVEGGLVTPVLRGAERLGLRDVAREMRTLADAARRRALPTEAFQGGTFTVSNLGMYPVSQFAAIVNPPQAAILAVAAAERRVVALDDQHSAVRRVMSVTLSVDHRVADGVAGAEFLADLKALVEDPRRALL